MEASGINRGFAAGFLTYIEKILSEWAQDQPVYDRLVQDREHHIRDVLELEEAEQQEGQLSQEGDQHESKHP